MINAGNLAVFSFTLSVPQWLFPSTSKEAANLTPMGVFNEHDQISLLTLLPSLCCNQWHGLTILNKKQNRSGMSMVPQGSEIML